MCQSLGSLGVIGGLAGVEKDSRAAALTWIHSVGRQPAPSTFRHTNRVGGYRAVGERAHPRRSIDGVVDLGHDDRGDVSQLQRVPPRAVASLERLRLIQTDYADLLVDIMHARKELLPIEQGHLDGHPSMLSKAQIVDESGHRSILRRAPLTRNRPLRGPPFGRGTRARSVFLE